MLLAAVKETRSHNGDIRLAAVQPNVRKVLSLSGFTTILIIFDVTQSALASFSQP
jgi:anti-sigma B factor antagonist